MGLNSALATAGRSLEIFTAGIQVAGQNISNANTPGYIREELLLEPNEPYRQGALIFGTGVVAAGIVQKIDRFLETRIHTANSDVSAASARESIYKQLEAEIRELGDTDLSTSLNEFLSAINEVVNQPESASLRQLAVQQGEQFANNLAALRNRIDELREAQTVKINSLTQEANRLIDQIVDVNPKIARLEASGLLRSEASALRTERYQALTRLSEIVPIKFVEREDRSVDVFTDSDYLILGGSFQHFETFTEGDRNVTVSKVQLSVTKSNVSSISGGEIRGIIDGRDNILGGFVDDLDAYTSQLIQEFNRIHTSGEGLRGFDTSTAFNRVLSPTAALNATAAGLSFIPQHGSFQIKVANQLSGITETTNITIDLDGVGTDTTLQSLQAALDGINNLSASITTDGRLKVDADANFEFRFASDTSGVLNALGINTFFTGSNSTDIAVNSLVSGNPEYLATGQGGGPSDGSNAVELATFVDNPLSGLNGMSLDDHYDNLVARIAQSSASETAMANGFASFRDSLLNQRDQFSGVSLDEEAIKVLEFQKAFQSAARIISTIDELFTILLTM